MVGVIASLAVFFALNTLFDRTVTVSWGAVALDLPVWATWQPTAFGITGLALARCSSCGGACCAPSVSVPLPAHSWLSSQ